MNFNTCIDLYKQPTIRIWANCIFTISSLVLSLYSYPSSPWLCLVKGYHIILHSHQQYVNDPVLHVLARIWYCQYFNFGHYNRHHIMALICISLVANNGRHLLFGIHVSNLAKYLCRPSVHFWIEMFSYFWEFFVYSKSKSFARYVICRYLLPAFSFSFQCPS
jgi:hypothetical protein